MPAEDNPQQQLIDYIGKLTHPEFEEDKSMSTVCAKFPQLTGLKKPVFKKKPAPVGFIGFNWALGFLGFFAFLRVQLNSRVLLRYRNLHAEQPDW